MEIPDALFRSAKARAAERGIPLCQFVTEAAEENLKAGPQTGKPWMNIVGKMSHLHKENLRIDKIVEEEFEAIEPEDWR